MDTKIDNGYNIGSWLSRQKLNVKGTGSSKMNENRLIRLLNCNNFYEWYISHQDECLPQFKGFHSPFINSVNKWMNKYYLCIEYEKSNRLIKYNTKTDAGDTIGTWLDNQKLAVKGKGTTVMSEDRFIQLLNCRTFNEWYISHQDECLPQFKINKQNNINNLDKL